MVVISYSLILFSKTPTFFSSSFLWSSIFYRRLKKFKYSKAILTVIVFLLQLFDLILRFVRSIMTFQLLNILLCLAVAYPGIIIILFQFIVFLLKLVQFLFALLTFLEDFSELSWNDLFHFLFLPSSMHSFLPLFQLTLSMISLLSDLFNSICHCSQIIILLLFLIFENIYFPS